MTNIDAQAQVPTGHSTKLIVPQIGEVITVTLPGEIIRAEVVRILDDDNIVCKLQQPMAKSHSFHKNDLVNFHRAKGFMREHWEADR